MHSSVRGMLLSWGSSFVGKKGKGLARLLLYALFGSFEGREIGEPLRNVIAWTK